MPGATSTISSVAGSCSCLRCTTVTRSMVLGHCNVRAGRWRRAGERDAPRPRHLRGRVGGGVVLAVAGGAAGGGGGGGGRAAALGRGTGSRRGGGVARPAGVGRGPASSRRRGARRRRR